MKLKKYILSKVSKQYTKIHTIVDIISVDTNTITVNVRHFNKDVISIDRIEVPNIKQLIIDFNLKQVGIV